MSSIKKIEDKMAASFKDLPHLPESSRKGLADIWPWLALIGGILQLVVAFGLWQLTRVVGAYTDLANSLAAYTGQTVGLTSTDKMVIYLGIVILLADAVILLMAFPKLQQRLRAGWDLLFLAALVNLAYAVVTIFIDGRGLGSFIMSLVGSAIGFYLLFEVREKFGGKTATT